MAKLTDTQSLILSRASTRPCNLALPLPDGLHGAAAKKVVTAMITRGWLEEAEADLRKRDPLWRETGDGHGTTLVATVVGLEAIGIESVPADRDAQPTAPGTPRAGTKQAVLVGMLRAEGGATIGGLIAATGWQPHTIRGAMSGALKKKLGLTVTSEKVEGRGRVYRLPPI
jgi:hypothetical protein